MTDYAGKSNEELASAFIISTCQLIPKSSLVYSDHMHNLLGSNIPVPNEYSILCGSNTEFYIRPLTTCIDDADYLVVQSDKLVFSRDSPVLPSDLSGLTETIKCLLIEPYDRYPGFVRLRVLGHMNYNWKLKKYAFYYTGNTISHATLKLDRVAETYLPETFERSTLPNVISGPAIKHRSDEKAGYFLEIDFVRCFWCHQWPKEAESWLNRPRLNGWPTTDTICEVVQSGCHLVYVQHRSCRNDDMQWRFSFSFAEVILLQSWTQTQQLVYHLLRFIAKRELMQNDCPKEDEVLCSYHFKTLMLWACEEMSPEWWNSASVLAICGELLKMLAEWFKNKNCPNYFIQEANLFHEKQIPKRVEKTEKRLNELCNPGVLCHWFVENYILSFIRRHLKPTGTMETMSHYVYYMSYIFEIWRVSELHSLDFYFSTTFAHCCKSSRHVIKYGYNSGLCQSFKAGYKFISHEFKANWILKELPTTQVLGFAYYDIQLHVLHTIYGLDCGEISWDGSLFLAFVKAISMQSKIVRSQYHNFPKTFTTQSSHFQFLRAQGLMENLTGSNSRSEFHLLSLMAKQLLSKALKHHDSISNGIVPAAWSYLAALHFAAAEYQEARRLCSAVLVDQTSQEDKETLNAGCLLFMDDVARIVGLCVLHRKITEDNLYHINRPLYLDMRLTPETFAQYLLVLSDERMSRQSDLYHNVPDSFFSIDVNVKALIKLKFSMISGFHCNSARQIVYRRPYSLIETDASRVNPLIVKERVLDALMEYASENMTFFYNALRRNCGFDCRIIVDCYRALYLYKCRQYDQVMRLCERILKDSDLQNDWKEFSFTHVLLLPPLDSFFDKDVQFLLGFHTLFYGLSPLNDHLGKLKFGDESTFNHWFARHVCTYKHELVHSLRFSYSIKCHYVLGRHFLAKYLKLRCCIDCNLPYSEASTELAAHKTNLPFELIIHRFILQKLRIKRHN